jgi:hypothetical protein
MATILTTPLTRIKVTLFMVQGKFSWSETHYLINIPDFVDAIPPATVLAGLRAALLGNNAALVQVRLSKSPASRQVFDLNPSTWTHTGVWPSDPAGGTYSSDRAYSALMMRISTNLAPGKNLYLAGIPDNVIETGPTIPDGYVLQPAFSYPLYAYMNYLVGSGGFSGWGYRSRDAIGDMNAVGISTSALYPNAVGISSLTTLPGVGLGKEVFLSGWRRINPRVPGLSGAYNVVGYNPAGVSTAFDTYFLGETGNVAPTNLIPFGKIGPLVYDYVQYQSWSTRKAVSRKRGGSFDLPRGRSRVRS